MSIKGQSKKIPSLIIQLIKKKIPTCLTNVLFCVTVLASLLPRLMLPICVMGKQNVEGFFM